MRGHYAGGTGNRVGIATRRRRWAGRGPRTADLRPKTEARGSRTEDYGQRVADQGPRTKDQGHEDQRPASWDRERRGGGVRDGRQREGWAVRRRAAATLILPATTGRGY